MLHGYLDLPTFTFWKEKNIWTGSLFRTFNYRIFKNTVDDKDELKAVIWYGMECFDLVKPNEFVFETSEDFSPEGLEKIIEVLNEKVAEFKKEHDR